MSKDKTPTPACTVMAAQTVYATNMSKREYFAGLAMQGLLATNATYGGKSDDRRSLAKDAVAHSDALLAELSKGGDA